MPNSVEGIRPKSSPRDRVDQSPRTRSPTSERQLLSLSLETSSEFPFNGANQRIDSGGLNHVIVHFTSNG
jgi:hypothetical protein